MTNRDYLEGLSTNDLAHILYTKVLKLIPKTNLDPEIGLRDWLGEEYNKKAWYWNTDFKWW